MSLTETARATMNDARRAWEAHPKPTLRAVVQALAAQGLSCSVETLRRWHKATWIDRQLTPTPVDSSEYDELNRQDLRCLSQEAVRQSLIAQILLARHVGRHAESIATEAPDKAAKILEALKGPWANATIGADGRGRHRAVQFADGRQPFYARAPALEGSHSHLRR